MNTDTGRIYTPEEIAEYKILMESIPTQKEFSLSEYIQKYKPDLKELAEEMLLADQEKKLMEMKIPPSIAQMKRNPPKVGRNEPCPCSSGKKFKKCCWTGRHD